MKEYQVDIKPTAEKDIQIRYLQIAKESPQNAIHWYLELIEAIQKLNHLAKRCPIAPGNNDVAKEIRHLVIGNYRVLYTINNDSVEVLHVRHKKHDIKW